MTSIVPITFITVGTRPSYIKRLRNNIQQGLSYRWIIVYDGLVLDKTSFLFTGESHIKEYIHKSDNQCGNASNCTNFALDLLCYENYKGLIYYLNEEDQMRPEFYKMLKTVEMDRLYTFDQSNWTTGKCTPSILVDFSLCSSIRWLPNEENNYIKACFENNQSKWIYIKDDFFMYNPFQENKHTGPSLEDLLKMYQLSIGDDDI